MTFSLCANPSSHHPPLVKIVQYLTVGSYTYSTVRVTQRDTQANKMSKLVVLAPIWQSMSLPSCSKTPLFFPSGSPPRQRWFPGRWARSHAAQEVSSRVERSAADSASSLTQKQRCLGTKRLSLYLALARAPIRHCTQAHMEGS